jgi:hypothetical protein
MGGILKKWWFWVGVLAVIGIAANKNGGGSTSSSSGETKVINGVGKITFSVPKGIAGEKNITFQEVTEEVFTLLKDNPEVKTLDVTMKVECEDVYGKWNTKESHVTCDSDVIAEMRKFAGPSNLSYDCMDWQMRFEVGYKMCGQID